MSHSRDNNNDNANIFLNTLARVIRQPAWNNQGLTFRSFFTDRNRDAKPPDLIVALRKVVSTGSALNRESIKGCIIPCAKRLSWYRSNATKMLIKALVMYLEHPNNPTKAINILNELVVTLGQENKYFKDRGNFLPRNPYFNVPK